MGRAVEGTCMLVGDNRVYVPPTVVLVGAHNCGVDRRAGIVSVSRLFSCVFVASKRSWTRICAEHWPCPAHGEYAFTAGVSAVSPCPSCNLFPSPDSLIFPTVRSILGLRRFAVRYFPQQLPERSQSLECDRELDDDRHDLRRRQGHLHRRLGLQSMP